MLASNFSIHLKKLAFISIMFSGFFSSANAETRFSTSYEFFDIGGTTIEELWYDIETKGPGKGRGHAGYTTFDLENEVKYRRENGMCSIANIIFTMHSTVQLPNWTDKNKSDRNMQIYWQALFSDVKRHEEEHVRIAHEAIIDLQKKSAALKPQKSCNTIAKQVTLLAQRNRSALNRAQNIFERAEMRGQRKRMEALIRDLQGG